MDDEPRIQIQTTLHVPVGTWEAWCARCLQQRQDPIAVFNAEVGLVVEAFLRGVSALEKDG